MKRVNMFFAAVALVAAVTVTVISAVIGHTVSIDQVAGILNLSNGETVLARYDGDDILLDQITASGTSRVSVSIPREKSGELYSLLDMAADGEGNLFLLKDVMDAKTGKRIRQQLEVYDLSRLVSKRVQRYELSPEENMRYRWIQVSGSVVLMGTDEQETTLLREAYDLGSVLAGGELSYKSLRTYYLAGEEGIYDAVLAGSDVAYTTRSGKVFLAREDDAVSTEVYPARVLETLMYPLYIAPQDTDSVYIGEQESGDILSLTLSDGSTQVLKTGTEPFSGASSYAPVDIMAMSMTDPQNFSGLARSATEGFVLVVSTSGQTTVSQGISHSVLSMLSSLLITFLGTGVIVLLVLQLFRGFFVLIGQSRTILVKLMVATLPLLTLALAFFGYFSYQTYRDSIYASFEKQVEDEGNMLTALFGTESFDEIEYPYDYTVEGYTYLRQQMSTRAIHTATAYYEEALAENGMEPLYVGVDFDYPCFYPFDVRLNTQAYDLYQMAAFSGSAQIGFLDDANGPRIACVTPIGGASGDTVYLLETGILMDNMDSYTDVYLRNFVLVSLIFLVGIGLALGLVFTRILRPIGEIKLGLEEFSKGNRGIRLEDNASDEFSDIIRVFNKMANDIDAQIYSLRQASETYFRFIPPRMLTMLGKENLGDVELGSSKEQVCRVLNVSLKLHSGNLTQVQQQELLNQLFGIVNTSAEEKGATVMTDSVSLRRLRVLCPEEANLSVDLALTILSRVDAMNAGLPVQNRLDVLLVLHRARCYYGICGEEERLVPALLCDELDQLADDEAAMRQFSCRLILTADACEGLQRDRYFHRFIGYLENTGSERIGLYDFYDCTPPEETRLIGETKSTFDKAMELYLQKRYYDAKNLFALVLRQNQYDNVSRYYIFQCEKKL